MIIALIILIYLLLHFYYSTSLNKRHLTNEYNFAHFSRITDNNKWFFPQLLLTKPLKYTVIEGEALWIPRGWWHWVKSEPGTMAISYWCAERQGPMTPYTFTFEIDDTAAKIDNVLFELQNVEIWNSSTDKINLSKIQKKNDSCIITLPGYSDDVKTPYSNKELYDRLKEHMSSLPVSTWEGCNVDANLWVALGYHDTGLHYDDNDGVLKVVRGRKEVLLYPPNQSHLLSPICVIPAWAKQPPRYVKYNTNEILHTLEKSFPSARLLYESIENKEVLKEITARVKGDKAYTWGCKWYNGEMRWELYVYFFDNIGGNITDDFLKTYDPDILTKKNPEPLAIVSLDLYDRCSPVGDTKHRYYSKSPIGLPFWGYGTQGETEEHESVFVLDQTPNFILKFNEYMDQLEVKDVDPIILKKYACEQMCVFNKKEGEIFVMYLGISVQDFIAFLIENNYPARLVTHVMENLKMYEQVRHEVTIVYDIKTLKHIRTGFYGVT